LASLLGDLSKYIERKRDTALWLKERKRNSHYGGIWQHMWPEVPRKSFVSRRIELDTRLQVELGKQLAFYLRPLGVSLETIARLVLLAYLVGELASEEKTEKARIRTHFTGRILTVRNIRDNLRYAGLHKAEMFRARELEDKGKHLVF